MTVRSDAPFAPPTSPNITDCRDGWFFLFCLAFAKQSVSFPLKARSLFLCPERQRKQNALCLHIPKVLKITARLSASPLLGDNKLISATYLILYQSVILRFLLSALHRLLTELLYLKQPFLSVSANRYRFNQSVLVCAPLRGAVLFMNSYSDIR